MIEKFIKTRLKERTTLDGAVLIGAGIAFLIFKPILIISDDVCTCFCS